MIIKKLREKKHWSQEQLAIMSGLSTRTIQRIESGNNASIESLKAISSVFEVDIDTLTKEITVIDKESAEWLAEPFWFRMQFFGVKKKRHALIGEYLMLTIAAALFFMEQPAMSAVIFAGTYCIAKLHHRMDIKRLW